MFGSQKILRKEKKNIKKNDFIIFGSLMKNTKKISIN